MEISVRGENFELLPERLLHWPKHRLLAVADLHLGKAEVFQRQGLYLPSRANSDDLDLLTQTAFRVNAQEIIFLGDLVHSAKAVPGDIEDLFARWSQAFPGRVRVVLGNHDRGLDKNWPEPWKHIEHAHDFDFGDFVFQHDEPPMRDGGAFYWTGHVHPVVTLAAGADRVRLPCFVVRENHGIVPAFSRLAGGYGIVPESGQAVYATTGNRVVRVGKTEKNVLTLGN